MCHFFSFISDGNGNFKYFDKDQRVLASQDKLLDASGNKIELDKTDSHAALASFYKMDEDKCNKYEFIPDEDKFVVDRIGAADDSEKAKAWAMSLSYGFIARLRNLNTGYYNTGNYNTGYYNTGNCNTGYDNTGNCNTGNYNTGYCNTGNYNTGNYNTGNCNTGNCNTGNCNTGYYNTGNYNSGLFNTNTPHVRLFNRQSKLSWDDPRIQKVLGRGPCLTEWVYLSEMTEDEKKKHPSAQTTGGYLKQLNYKDAWKKYWGNADEATRQAFLSLPFFDAKIFEEITGIQVDQPKRGKKV